MGKSDMKELSGYWHENNMRYLSCYITKYYAGRILRIFIPQIWEISELDHCIYNLYGKSVKPISPLSATRCNHKITIEDLTNGIEDVEFINYE